MTPEAINRIVKAVGKEPIDRAKLAAELDVANTIILSPILSPGRRARTKHHTLRSIYKAAEKLAAAIDSNWLAGLGASSWLRNYAAIVRDVEAKTKGRRPSLKEYLAGFVLPGIYERQFGKQATATRTTRRGSFMSFAKAASEELGQKCETETIIKGFSLLKSSRTQASLVQDLLDGISIKNSSIV
jgi:hypothetical protein